MGKPKSPATPDPADAAKVQAQTNISTAQANSALGNINQITPYGSLTYDVTGHQFVDDPNGSVFYRGPNGEIKTNAPMKTVREPILAGQSARQPYNADGPGGASRSAYYAMSGQEQPAARVLGYRGKDVPEDGWSRIKGYYVPTYTAKQTLSPAEQKKLEATQAAEINLANLAKGQSARLSGLLDRPVDINNKATEARLFQLGRSRLDPLFQEREDRARTRLANQGITSGSEAFGREMRGLSESENDAYNQLLLQGRAQAVQEALTERNQPLNEIIGLLGGSQVNVPQFAGAGGGGGGQLPNIDMAGLQQQAFQNRFGKYTSELSSYNQTMGGLMSAAGAIAAAAISDRRAKEGIKKVGKVGDFPVYSFRYKGSPKTQIGFMAQDVEKKKPEAVTSFGGLKMVDYEKALA